MLTLFAERAESLWDEVLPVEVRELPADLAALDRVLADPGMFGADRRAVASRDRGDGSGGADGRAPDGRDGDVHQVDGGEAALPLGVGVRQWLRWRRRMRCSATSCEWFDGR